ncbi:hypothetical protein V8C86DRAFT_2446938 [Haematococcus lacustris]
MDTQNNTEAIVDRSWKYVAASYPQPSSPKLLKWDKYFAYFNDHFKGIQETSPPEGLKPFATLWDIYKQASPSSSQPQQQPAPAAAPAAASPSSMCAAAPSPNPCPTATLSSGCAAAPRHTNSGCTWIEGPHHRPRNSPASRCSTQPCPLHSPVAYTSSRRAASAPSASAAPSPGTQSAVGTGGQQHQHQQQDLRQVTEEEEQQPGEEGAAPSSSKRPRPAEDQALIQSLIQKVDNLQDTVNRLEGKVYQLPTLLPYRGDVYQPHEPQQCRLAALAQGLTIFQLPQLAIDMPAVVAASILITRVYNHMVFSSVDAKSKTKYGTGQRVQVVLAKSAKNSSGDLDTTLKLLSAKDNAAMYSTLSTLKKKEVDEAKKVLTQYLTLLQPVLKQLLGRPLNALATIITDPTWQRSLNKEGEMVTTLAKQLAQAQAPHTDFLPVGPGMDDGLVFLLALQDFPLVAYMGSHNLSQLAAAHCRRTADGKKQVVDVEEMDALAMTMPHQLGTEVLVKAGQLALFRGNTVHAGNVGVAGSCCARLYGFGRPDTVVDNTTMNTSELGDLYHGLFQPIQGEGIGPKMADWNRRNMAGQTLWMWCQDPVCQNPVGVKQDPVGQDPVVWCQDPVVPGPCRRAAGPCRQTSQDPDPVRQNPVSVQQDPVGQDPVDPVSQDPVVWCQDPVGQNPVVWCQNPVVWCQDPVMPGPCGEVPEPCSVVPGSCGVVPEPCGVVPGPCGARTLWTLWCQDPVVRGQDPVGQDPVVKCQDPVGQDLVVWCQDPVVWCQDAVGQNPVVRCQDPVGVQQDPVVWCQDPVDQDPVMWCQDRVSHNPVVRFQGPVEKDTHRRTLYRVLAHMVESIQTGST